MSTAPSFLRITGVGQPSMPGPIPALNDWIAAGRATWRRRLAQRAPSAPG